MDERPYAGFIDTRTRILEEILSKTTFKDSLRLFLKNIDPDSSPELVRTLLGKDIEVPLALMAAMAPIANCLIKGVCELIVQIREKFPSPLLAGFVESLLDDIDTETLSRIIKEAGELWVELEPAFHAAWIRTQGTLSQDKGGE